MMRTESEQAIADTTAIRKLLRGGSFAFAGKLITYPLGLILTMVFARLLSTADVGGYFLAMSLIMLASGLVQAGLATTMNKVIARSLAKDNHVAVRQTIKTGIAALVIGGTIASLLLVDRPGQWLFASLEDGEVLAGSAVWIATLVVAFAGINYCCEMLRGFHELPAAALLDQQLLQRLLLLFALLIPLGVGLTLKLDDVLRIAAITAICAWFAGIVLVRRQVSRLDDRGHSLATRVVISEAPTFLLLRVNNWILNSAAVWVIGFARPLEEAALYGAGNAIALLVLASWQVVSAAIGPTVVTLHANRSVDALQNVVRSAGAVGAVPALVLAVIIYTVGDSLLAVLFTPEYAAGATILIILAAGRALSTLFGTPIALLSMTHHQDIVSRVLFATSTLTLIAYISVVESFGATGVAAISALSVIIQSIVLTIFAWRVVGINTLPAARKLKLSSLGRHP